MIAEYDNKAQRRGASKDERELEKLKNQVRDKINKTDSDDILRDILHVFKRYKLFYGKE